MYFWITTIEVGTGEAKLVRHRALILHPIRSCIRSDEIRTRKPSQKIPPIPSRRTLAISKPIYRIHSTARRVWRMITLEPGKKGFLGSFILLIGEGNWPLVDPTLG